MPLYEYTCRDCKNEFELLVRDGEKPVCPTCEGGKLDKLMSVPAAHVASGGDLPVCGAPPGACGMGACGGGGCPME